MIVVVIEEEEEEQVVMVVKKRKKKKEKKRKEKKKNIWHLHVWNIFFQEGVDLSRAFGIKRIKVHLRLEIGKVL